MPYRHSGTAYVNGNEFYAKYTGYELRNFPDVPIHCSPLVSTSTHRLAIETNPRWVMVIRHVGSWRIKTRPKVRIYPEGSAIGKIAVAFALPACHRFETPDAAFRMLQDTEFTLSPHNLNMVAFQKDHTEQLRKQIKDEIWSSMTEDEVLSMLEYYTELRLASVAKRPKHRKPPKRNVIDLQAVRQRVEQMMEQAAQDAEYARSLAG